MQKVVIFIITVLVVAGLAACGSAAPATSVAPAATEAPSKGGKGTPVQVTLRDNTIESSITSFQAGVPYTFTVTNSGQHAHNFNIAPPTSVTGSLDAALQQALLSVPQSKLAVGQTVTVDFTFPASAVGAKLEFSCLIPRHYELGMLLPITVTK